MMTANDMVLITIDSDHSLTAKVEAVLPILGLCVDFLSSLEMTTGDEPNSGPSRLFSLPCVIRMSRVALAQLSVSVQPGTILTIKRCAVSDLLRRLQCGFPAPTDEWRCFAVVDGACVVSASAPEEARP